MVGGFEKLVGWLVGLESWLVGWLVVDGQVSWCFGSFVNWYVRGLVGCLVGSLVAGWFWSVGGLVRCWIGMLVSWLVGWWVSGLVGGLVSW